MAQALTESVDSCYQIKVSGLVQGVGFRPFIYQLARQYGLGGWVKNDHAGVEIQVQGRTDKLDEFVHRISSASPPSARIAAIQVQAGETCIDPPLFAIRPSDDDYQVTDIPPDMALCSECRNEILDSADRRFGYPFNACTTCGPRYTMISAMPYDRPHTSMVEFTLCSSCQDDYSDAGNRRFHGQGISCPECGPQLTFLSSAGNLLSDSSQVCLDTAVSWLANKKILAVKGIGGFHICCDAQCHESVGLLRLRKQRPDKPLAVMMEDVAQVSAYFSLTDQESALLQSPAAPIVLLPKRRLKPVLSGALASNLAPKTSFIGVMLAYSPLHLLLLRKFGAPLVMTSGNVSGAPVCVDNQTALSQLHHICDGFVMHDRSIINRCDDSVIKIIAGKPGLIRRARGYVPVPFPLSWPAPDHLHLLAMGADLKNCFALCKNGKLVLSAHNGDMGEADVYLQTKEMIEKACQQLSVKPEIVIVDKHPDYFSHRLGKKLAAQKGLPVIEVQHHHAHLASCMVEHGLDPREAVLAVTLDGLGYGEDGTLWGGELLLGDLNHCQRIGGFKPFPLLGGDKANIEPWRNLLSLLAQGEHNRQEQRGKTFHNLPAKTRRLLSCDNAKVLAQHRDRYPLTSSAGRVFDAAAALILNFHGVMSYEGQAAIELESLALLGKQVKHSLRPLSFDLLETDGYLQLDPASIWPPLIAAMSNGVPREYLAYWFHQSFADSWAALVLKACEGTRLNTVLLSGGVFQNQLIAEMLEDNLQQAGLTVFRHHNIPGNDAGIAVGQIAVALNRLEQRVCV